jgi:hypothetical protein
MKSEYHVMLSSNDSTDTFPNNSITSFTNVLPPDLNMINNSLYSKGYWFATLDLISFHTNFTNTPPYFENCKPHFVIFSKIRPKKEIDPEVLECSIATNQNYANPEELIHYLNNMIPGEILKNRLKFSLTENKKLTFTAKSMSLLVHNRIANFLCIENCPHDLKSYKGKPYKSYNFQKNLNTNWNVLEAERSFTLTQNIPKYIRVVMTNLYNNPGSQRCANTLGVFPYKKSVANNRTSFFAEKRRHEHIKLVNTNLKTLSVQLQNEEGQQLYLTAGQPSFLKMHFKHRNDGSFIMQISSKDVNALGINSNFTINLASPLLLQSGYWRVALSSMQFPTRFNRFTEEDAKDIQIKIRQNGFPDNDILLLKDAYNGTSNLINAISQEFEQKSSKKIQILIENNHTIISFSTKEENNIELLFDHKLAILLGMIDTHVPHEMHSILGHPGYRYTSPFKIHLNRMSPNAMMIYADLVVPGIFGSKYLKILKTIPVHSSPETDDDLTQNFESTHLDFLPLIHTRISNINFKLLQLDEKPVSFTNNTEEVLYNLLFTYKK